MESFARCWRLELFFKSAEELKSKTIPFLRDQQFSRFNLTNKVALGLLHYSEKWSHHTDRSLTP